MDGSSLTTAPMDSMESNTLSQHTSTSQDSKRNIANVRGIIAYSH